MNVLGMGPMELLLIVVLALIVFGPAKLPQIMGQVGKAIADFRRATSDLSDEFNRTIQSELQETRAMVDDAKLTITDAKAAVTDVHSSVNAAVTGAPAPVRTALPSPEPLASTPVANGVSGEAHATTGANGSVAAQGTPPLGDTGKWSWEVSGPAPKAVSEAASTSQPATSDAPGEPGSAGAGHDTKTTDDLLPPY